MKNISTAVQLLAFVLLSLIVRSSSMSFSDESLESGDVGFLSDAENYDFDCSNDDFVDEDFEMTLTASDLIRDISMNYTSKKELYFKAGLHLDCPCVEISIGKTLDPLEFAIFHKSHEWIEALLQSGDFDANAWNEMKKAYLIHFAATYGDLQGMEILLNHGADIECLDGKGRTPLVLAMMNGNQETFSLLLANGGTVDSDICFFASRQKEEYYLGEILKRQPKTLDINAFNEMGSALIHVALREMFSEKMLDLILAFPGVDINLPEAVSGTTALMIAVQCLNQGAIKALTARGADVSARGFHGKTAFDLAFDSSPIREVLLTAEVKQRIYEKFKMVKDLRNFGDLPNDVRNIILANFLEIVGLKRADDCIDHQSRWDKIDQLKVYLNSTPDLGNMQRIRFIHVLGNLVIAVGKEEWSVQVSNIKQELIEEFKVAERGAKGLQRACNSFDSLHDSDFYEYILA